MTTAVDPPLTIAEVLSLPPLIDLATAARVLGIGRATGYDVAARGEFPVEVVSIGKRLKIRTADLIEFCRLDAVRALIRELQPDTATAA